MNTITFTELLETMDNNYHEMFNALGVLLNNKIQIRFIHDKENRCVHLYDSFKTKVVEDLETPLLTVIYSFNEPKIFVDCIPGCHLISLVPNPQCLYQLIVLAQTNRMNVESVMKFYEL